MKIMAQKISSYFDYTIGGKQYKIRFKTPKVGEQIAIGQRFAAYKAGFPTLDETSELLAYASATLDIVIVDKPADLNFEDIDTIDWPVLRKMLTDYQNFAFFRDKAPSETSPS
jgi:hypothetical protein